MSKGLQRLVSHISRPIWTWQFPVQIDFRTFHVGYPTKVRKLLARDPPIGMKPKGPQDIPKHVKENQRFRAISKPLIGFEHRKGAALQEKHGAHCRWVMTGLHGFTNRQAGRHFGSAFQRRMVIHFGTSQGNDGRSGFHFFHFRMDESYWDSSTKDLLWPDEILHHLRNCEVMIPR